MSRKELEAEIKKQDLKDRAALAKWIVESLDELSEVELEALWVDEAEHRLDEIERGLVAKMSAEEVFRRARWRSNMACNSSMGIFEVKA